MTKSHKKWMQVWHAGVIALAVVYAIDATLIRLGAFSYICDLHFAGGLPLFYWLSAFFGGVLLVRYYPRKSIWKLPYILLADFMFLVLEHIMRMIGYFRYHNWSLINSFFLDIVGFIIVIWFWNWINEIRSE